MRIYYKPHQSRNREAEFFRTFEKLGGTVIPENFSVNPIYLDSLVDTHRLVQALRQSPQLPDLKRRQCIEILEDCPSQIKVAFKPSYVSFDIVVVEAGKPHYWEFHEEQHRRLTVDRPKKIFTPRGEPIEAPRFLQRLVRDVWRALHFLLYTIVWSDWFAKTREDYGPALCEGFQEFYLPEEFSFEEFLRIYKI